ncbi:TonB-dependent receptor domain-containing protein [Chryseobacterium sp. A301]
MIQTEITQKLTRKTLGLTLLLSAAAFAFAQEKVSVSGNVVDKANNPVPYASIAFSSKSDLLYSDATLTDENGHYELQIVPGLFDITVEAIDFKKYVSSGRTLNAGVLGSIVLEPESNMTMAPTANIEGITLTATTKPYKVELDKRTYDPSSDVISKGGNLQDVLQNVPSVSVDTDGTVSMRGNSNIRFLINGKPSALLGIDDGANALQTIPADQIDRIEVITNPSSKYEASGTAGILNIILKKNKRIGFNGSVTGTLGYLPNTSLNTNLSWRRGNATWFLNGGGGYRKSEGNSYNNATFDDRGTLYQLLRSNSNTVTNNEMKNYNGTAGLVYDLSDRTSVNGSVTLRHYEGENESVISTESDYSGITRDNATAQYPISKERRTSGINNNNAFQADFGIDHEIGDKGSTIAASVSLQNNESTNSSDIFETRIPAYNTMDQTAQETKNRSVVAKVDYELPIGEYSKIEAGYRFDSRNNDYDYAVWNEGVVNPDFTSVTNYKEMFNAFYAQFKSKIGDNFAYQLGLRTELSKIDVDFRSLTNTEPAISKSYSNFFPSVFLSYNLTENNQLLLNYSKRINRPRSWFLVPFNSYNDSDNIFSGNPDLNPSYVDSFEFGYSFQKSKITFNPTLYYNHEKDETQMVNIYNFERQRFETKPYNIGFEDRYGLDMNFTYDPFSWLKLMGSLDLYGYRSEGEFNYTTLIDGVETPTSMSFNGKGFSQRARLNTTFKIDKTLNVQLQGFYRGGEETDTSKRDAMYALNLGASKTIWNGNGTFSFNIQDIFNTRNRTNFTYGDGFQRESYMQWQPRQFSLSFTYRFREGDRVDQPKRKKDINSNAEAGEDEMPPM